MTSFARKVLNDLPAPTNSATANNLQILQEFTNSTPKAGGKVDVQISQNLSLFGRVGWRDADILDQPPISGPSGGAGNARDLRHEQAVFERTDVCAVGVVAVRSAFRLVDHEGREESVRALQRRRQR